MVVSWEFDFCFGSFSSLFVCTPDPFSFFFFFSLRGQMDVAVVVVLVELGREEGFGCSQGWASFSSPSLLAVPVNRDHTNYMDVRCPVYTSAVLYDLFTLPISSLSRSLFSLSG